MEPERRVPGAISAVAGYRVRSNRLTPGRAAAGERAGLSESGPHAVLPELYPRLPGGRQPGIPIHLVHTAVSKPVFERIFRRLSPHHTLRGYIWKTAGDISGGGDRDTRTKQADHRFAPSWPGDPDRGILSFGDTRSRLVVGDLSVRDGADFMAQRASPVISAHADADAESGVQRE